MEKRNLLSAKINNLKKANSVEVVFFYEKCIFAYTK